MPKPFSSAIITCASLCLGGCGSLEPYAPPVTPAMAASAREDIDLLVHGRLIYTTRCTACHNAERVGRWSPSEWAGIIPRMAVEARLNDAQERAVRSYIMALAKSGG